MKIVWTLALVFFIAFTSTASHGGNCLSTTNAKLSDQEDISNLVLKTERLTLKPLESPEQMAELTKIFADENVRQMSGDVVDSYTLRSLAYMGQTNLQQVKSSGQPFINFAVYYEGKIVGMSQIATGQEQIMFSTGIAKYGETWVSISYHLDPSAWGKGIATEIGTRTTRFAFETLKVTGIHGEALKTNAGSIKVLEKLGLKRMDVSDPTYVHLYMNAPPVKPAEIPKTASSSLKNAPAVDSTLSTIGKVVPQTYEGPIKFLDQFNPDVKAALRDVDKSGPIQLRFYAREVSRQETAEIRKRLTKAGIKHELLYPFESLPPAGHLKLTIHNSAEARELNETLKHNSQNINGPGELVK